MSSVNFPTTDEVTSEEECLSLIERKYRVPQLQGVKERSRSKLLRALGNAEDAAPSAFPKGKQNGVVFRLEAISKLGSWSKVKADPSFNPQAN